MDLSDHSLSQMNSSPEQLAALLDDVDIWLSLCISLAFVDAAMNCADRQRLGMFPSHVSMLCYLKGLKVNGSEGSVLGFF